MASRSGRCVLLVGMVALQSVLLGCASNASERRENPTVGPGREVPASEPAGWRPGSEPFEVGCAFGISGCEAEVSERCAYAGYHVLGSYQTEGAFGTPYYYLRAACGPAPRDEGAPLPAPGVRPDPAGEAWVRGGSPAQAPGAFEVECRFGISGCERQVSQRCGYAGYHILGSYQTQGAFGSPYFYMKAACGPAPSTKDTAPASSPAPTVDAKPSPFHMGSAEDWATVWEGPRLLMDLPAGSLAKADGKAQADPFDGVQAKEAEELKALEAKAQGGSREAQSRLAARYATGSGLPRDLAKAREWYQKAAEQGEATAQNNLGVLHDRGEAVPRDLAKAASWYRKAAEQGAAAAQYNLALVHRLGIGAPKDDEQVASWLTKAAAQGLMNAQALLGMLCLRGEGVAKDEVLAYAWLNLAAAQGDERAAKTRDEIRLSPPGTTEAQRLSSHWKKGQVLRRRAAEKKDRTP